MSLLPITAKHFYMQASSSWLTLPFPSDRGKLGCTWDCTGGMAGKMDHKLYFCNLKLNGCRLLILSHFFRKAIVLIKRYGIQNSFRTGVFLDNLGVSGKRNQGGPPGSTTPVQWFNPETFYFKLKKVKITLITKTKRKLYVQSINYIANITDMCKVFWMTQTRNSKTKVCGLCSHIHILVPVQFFPKSLFWGLSLCKCSNGVFHISSSCFMFIFEWGKCLLCFCFSLTTSASTAGKWAYLLDTQYVIAVPMRISACVVVIGQYQLCLRSSAPQN